MKSRYPNVTVNPDRHGKHRARYRKAGHKPVYMKTLPDQPGFEAELAEIKQGVRAVESRAIPNSIADLCERYYRCADFAAKGNQETRDRRRRIIESFRAEFGNDMVADFTFEHIEAILLAKTEKKPTDKGRISGGQVAAVKLRKELARLFAHGKKIKMTDTNPVAEAGKVGKDRLDGFYPWTEEDIAQYQRRHPVGTKARLALEILLWTGQRRSDARLFGPKHIVRGKINFKAAKNGADLWLPVARDLKAAIEAMPSVGISTYLVTEYGQPFTRAGFGTKMREWCNQAGLPKCSAHGLRKAITRRMAQTQGTDEEMMAVGGWRTSSQLRTYTASVEQEGLADSVMGRIEARYSSEKDSPDA